MDRLAFQNMTNKNRNSDTGCVWPQQQYSQPVGETTSKSKINTEVNNYFLERLDKNSQEYNQFVNALNGNIKEDQHRTTINNTRWQSEHPINDTCQHVYHPTLLTDPERRTDNIGNDRYGFSTRDRQVNGMAQTKNTVMTPLPKLNYPQGYNHMSPIDMDMTSHLDQQFSSLTDPIMEQQISRLHKKTQTDSTQQAIQPPIGPMGPMGPFGSSYPNYNPQVDHMDQQMHQWSQEVPPQRYVDPSQLLDFQRPQSSNNRKLYPSEPVMFQTGVQMPPKTPIPIHMTGAQTPVHVNVVKAPAKKPHQSSHKKTPVKKS